MNKGLVYAVFVPVLLGLLLFVILSLIGWLFTTFPWVLVAIIVLVLLWFAGSVILTALGLI